MNITYLKPFGYKNTGDTHEVTDALGNYLVRCKVAVLTEDKPTKRERKSKADKQDVTTKELKEEIENK